MMSGMMTVANILASQYAAQEQYNQYNNQLASYGFGQAGTAAASTVTTTNSWITSVAPSWNPSVMEKMEPAETEEPNEPPHKHLQRRVNKWLKGVDLPLH